MTQLPPEHHDKAAHNRPAQRAPRDHTGLDWHSLLAGEAPATTPVAPLVPAASVGSSDPRVAGPTADPRAPQSAPHRNDPFAQTAPAGADGGQPLTRRERRELEEREAARQAGLEAEPAVPAEEPARSSRAARRATADSGYEHFDDHDGHEAPEKPKRRGAWGCLVGLLIVAGLGVGAYLFLQGPITAVVERFQPAADYQGSGTGEVVFMIHDGDTGSDIATNLVGEGVTASYDAFYDELLAERPEPEFHPGAYQLASEMSGRAALDALLDPANKLENTFVIPEGTATADALPSIAEGTGTPIEELQAAAAESPQSYGLPAEATSLEGFLFPATYTLDPGLDARGILQTLVDRQFQALDEAGVAPADRWKTIVLAALVQREAGLRDDYYKVSRVFQNRLDPAQWESGLLQSDATVAYGTGNTHRVSTTDAEREDAGNPFNTYVHPGLPVGPISNPGDLAIDAAVHPADGPWLYFVTWNLDSGETIFSTTQEEHDAAVEQWLSWMDEHPEYQ